MTDQNRKHRRFLIIRLSSLGDIIHTLPAYAALRENHPKAHISWLVEEKGNQILDLVPGINRVILSGLKKHSLFSIRFFREFLRIKSALSCRNQAVFDFQGLFKSGIYTGMTRARKRFGFHPRNLKENGARIFYTQSLKQLPGFIHIIDKNLKLLSLADIKAVDYRFPIIFPDSLNTTVSRKLAAAGFLPEQLLVVINVGAAWRTKQWPADRWIKVLQNVPSDNLFFLILWGTPQEKETAASIASATRGQLAPDFSLQEVMALLQRAGLVVSGDTFALQAACALNRPVIALFGPTHPARNGPFRERDRVLFHPLDCSYCYKRQCRDNTCIEKITVEEVLNAMREMLTQICLIP